MDEHTDNQQRRMLFTDFDVSDKGRPAAVITPEPPPGYYTAPLHSIAELASSIELDFEDDDGGVSSGRATATATATATEADDDDGADAEGRTKRIPHFAIPGDDQELSLDPADTVAAVAAPTPLPAIAIPTWEEFAKAFRSAQETPAGEEGRETGGANASAPDAATAPAPARPGAALTADEDGNIVHRSTPTAAYDPITDDDGDVDILSYFSGPNETGVFTSRDRRSVAPPPLVPYGGIERIEDWFSPPENQPEMHPASRDWFEPPEEAPPPAAEKAAAEETTVAAPENLGDLFDTVIFADGDLDQRISATTRRVDKPLSEKTAEGETGLDIFSGLDVESVWGDRLRQNHPRSHTGGDTGSLDMFSDIDLESMWNSRRGKRVTSDSARRFADDAMAQDRAGAGSDQSSDTVIFRRDPMNASDTVLVDRDEFFPPPGVPSGTQRAAARRPPSVGPCLWRSGTAGRR